jgi:hypothetical protein
MQKKTLALIGQTLGSNLILSLRTGKQSNTMATAQCGTCGKVFETHLASLKSGGTKSCGCLSKKMSAERLTTHGLKKHKHYKRAWSVDQRCNNPKSHNYKNYGGRGIECRFASIAELINYLGIMPGYFLGASIDRIDNDGHYEPGNLKWSTTVEQCARRRTPTTNTSGIQGLRWNKKRNAWQAQLSHNKQLYREFFPTHFEALFFLRDKQLKILGHTKHLGLHTDK